MTVSEIDVRRSLRVDSSILGTYEFYLDIGDVKVMFVAGDYLANFIATKQFPARSISLSLCEFSRIRWELDFKGGLTAARHERNRGFASKVQFADAAVTLSP